MTRIRFPINVVVIHGPNHVPIQKCGIHRIGLESRHECGGVPLIAVLIAGHGAVMLQQNLRVILLTAAKRTANGIEPKQFRGLNRFLGKMLVFQRARPFRNDV